MSRMNIYYFVVLSVLLVIALVIVVLSVIKQNKYYKKDSESHDTYVEDVYPREHTGLTNRNLSCFFNACVQMLFSLEEFRLFAENSHDERMPTVRAIGNLFREMRSGEGTVGNMEHYNAILKSIRRTEILPDEENCASQFLELLFDKIVEEERQVQNVSSQDFLNVSFKNFEVIRQRLEMVKLFGFLILPTGSPGYTTDYVPVGTVEDRIPMQIAWCVRIRAYVDMQHTFDAMLHGDIEFTPTRLVVDKRTVCKYLVLNFGSQGFSVGNIDWEGNEEVQMNEIRFSLVAMNLFRGNVSYSLCNDGGGHYMSCAKRDGVWYLFNDSNVEKTPLQSLQKSLTVTSAIFERIDMPETI